MALEVLMVVKMLVVCGLVHCNTVIDILGKHVTSIFWVEAVTTYMLHYNPEKHS